MTHPEPGLAPNPGLVFETMTAFHRTAALNAAIDLDLFRAIGDEAAGVPAIAQTCRASQRGIRVLCDYLTLLGFLSKEVASYRQTTTSRLFLDSRSPASMAPASRFMSNAVLHETMSHLTQIVRDGRTNLPGQGSVEPDNPMWVDFAHSMAPMMGAMAAPLGEITLESVAGRIDVLDIAAGHGLFGIEIAKQHPEAYIVAQDWQAVLAVAQANAAKAGVTDRYTLLPGSAFDVDYGGPYDRVLLTNFLHHFDRSTCVSLFQKIKAALKPGGKVLALEFVPNEDRVSPTTPAAFALIMLATTAAGDAYTFEEYKSMLLEAGYRDASAQPVRNGPHTVVIGHT